MTRLPLALARWLSFCALLLIGNLAIAEVQVFPVRGQNPQEILETLRATLGERAQVDMIQQKIVVVGDAKAIADASALMRKIDKLPTNLRLTLTEIPPTEYQDAETGMLVYTTDKNSQVMDTVEGAMMSAEYTKFHQTVSATDGWMFVVENEPTAIQRVELQVRMTGARSVEIVMSFARYENQERRVFGRIVRGDIGTWIPLLPQKEQPETTDNTVTYSSGEKRGEQLYLKVEKVFAPRPISPR